MYELKRWSQDWIADFILKDCLFGAVKLYKNPDKYSYLGYSIWFGSFSLFLYPVFDWGKMLLFLE